MRKRERAERKRKHRKRFRVIVEILLMALGVLCSIMPQPFPLLVPIGIGAIRIISNAARREREPEEKQSVVYCNGVQEPHKAKKSTEAQAVQTKPKKAATKKVKKGEQK